MDEGRSAAVALKAKEETVIHDKDRVARIISNLLGLAGRRSAGADAHSG